MRTFFENILQFFDRCSVAVGIFGVVLNFVAVLNFITVRIFGVVRIFSLIVLVCDACPVILIRKIYCFGSFFAAPFFFVAAAFFLCRNIEMRRNKTCIKLRKE